MKKVELLQQQGWVRIAFYGDCQLWQKGNVVLIINTNRDEIEYSLLSQDNHLVQLLELKELTIKTLKERVSALNTSVGALTAENEELYRLLNESQTEEPHKVGFKIGGNSNEKE